MTKTKDGMLDENTGYFIPFTHSKWTASDLEGQIVEFRWSDRGKVAEGNAGKFLVSDFKSEGLAIQITYSQPHADLRGADEHCHALTQAHVDAIEIHPDWNKDNPQSAKFRMFA